MTKRWLGFMLFVCGSATGFAVPGQGNQNPSTPAKPHKIFHDAIEQLRSGSSVPPRLPSFLPRVTADNQVFLNNVDFNSLGYDLRLGVERDCEGEHRCSYGIFLGSKQPIEPSDEKPVPILLWGGIRGNFYDTQCGAYCDESWIVWSQDGFYYAIGITAEKRAVLIRVANSAITTKIR